MMCFGEHITYLLYLLAICMWLEIATRQGRIKVSQDGEGMVSSLIQWLQQ